MDAKDNGAGSPLEKSGVASDVPHLMTRRDILEDNCDLMARAAQIIRQRPSFTLSATPVRRGGARAIVVSAQSTSTQVTISKTGHKTTPVEVGTWDARVDSSRFAG